MDISNDKSYVGLDSIFVLLSNSYFSLSCFSIISLTCSLSLSFSSFNFRYSFVFSDSCTRSDSIWLFWLLAPAPPLAWLSDDNSAPAYPPAPLEFPPNIVISLAAFISEFSRSNPRTFSCSVSITSSLSLYSLMSPSIYLFSSLSATTSPCTCPIFVSISLSFPS